MSQTTCYICGNPCFDWGSDSFSTCGPCANEIKKKNYGPNAILPNPPIQDGFGKSAWANQLLDAKTDWNKGLRTHCGICGESCKNWSDDDNDHYTSVCSKCDNEIQTNKWGAPSENTTDGNGFPFENPAWKESVEFVKLKFAKTKLEPGDRVEVKTFDPSGNITRITATVVDKLVGEDRWLLALDFAYVDSQLRSEAWHSGIYAGKAQALGIDTSKNTFWIVDPMMGTSKIDSVIEKKSPEQKKSELKKEKEMAVSTWDLEEGDRVKIRIDDRSDSDGEVYLLGTFLKRSDDNDGTAIIALDQEYHSDEYDSTNWYDLDEDGDELKRIAEKYPGIKTNRSNLWTAEDDPSSETKIVKVLKHQTPNKEKKEGKTEMKDTKTGREISYGELFKKDMGKAMIRSGTSAGIDGLKAGIRKMLAHDGVGTEGVEAVLKFLEGDFGDALLRAGLGNTLTFMPIPFIQENEYAQQVSEELRVSGLEKGLTKGRKMVQEFIVPSLMEAFASTPLMEKIMGAEEAKQRVAEEIAPKRVAEIPAPQAEELEVVEDPFKAGKQAHA